jgi:hypothetical protein
MTKCKICGIEQTKEKVGTRRTGSIFVNELNLEWNGLTCPSCNVKRSNKNMKKLRSEKK